VTDRRGQAWDNYVEDMSSKNYFGVANPEADAQEHLLKHLAEGKK